MSVSGLMLLLVLIPFLIQAQQTGSADTGKDIYLERCVLCHGAVGQGWDWGGKAVRPPVPVPNLVKVVPQRSDAYLMNVIRDGGEAVGLTSFMPAFGFNMSEQDLQDVVAYLRSLPRRAK
jgi:mono/diheme cytochrome c family protein